jgi:serine/threonine protein kinase
MEIIFNDFGSVGQFEEVSECALDLLARLLPREPGDRLSAEEALRHSWFDDVRLNTFAETGNEE